MKTSIFAVIAVVLVALAVVLLWYLRKSMLFSKGNYGKKTVKSILNRYAISRNYKVLENVQLQLDGKTQTIDFVLVGFFGLLFVSALQGEGDFYGDLKEPRWSFVDADHDRKVRFDNPVLEMDKKVDLFRRLMSQKKVYNLKIDTAVVVVGTKSEVPMYLSHMGEENIVMTVKFSDIATLLPLAPSGFAVPYKNHPLLFSLPTANCLLFSCLPCVFLVPPCVLKQRDCSALFPKNFPFFAKKYRDKLCSLLSCQKKFAQSKSNILLFHAPFFTKSTKSAFAPNGAQQIFVALPN